MKIQFYILIELPETEEDTRFETPFSRPEDNTVENTMAYQLSIPKDVTGRLKSLEEIFSSLHVKSDGCRKRFVCHLALEFIIILLQTRQFGPHLGSNYYLTVCLV